jgi:GTPase SAR1 family protein
MFHEDGTTRKSCKSNIVKQFENEVSPVLPLPEFDPSLTTYIRDSMALVQCMDEKKHRTFGDLATDYCRELTSCFAKAHTVAVFDRYDVKNSIKSAERERRTKVTAHTKVFQVIEGRNIPDWKKFLSVKENK